MVGRLMILSGLLCLIAGSATAGETLKSRLARKVECNPEELAIHDQLRVPFYSRYEFLCEGKKWRCHSGLFFQKCRQGWSEDDDEEEVSG
jgi:hypothetical protein